MRHCIRRLPSRPPYPQRLRRKRAGRQEQGRREDFHLTDNHGNGQGFAQSTGQAQDNAGENTALSSRQNDVSNRFPTSRAEAVRSFAPRFGNSRHCVGSHRRNRRENHDGQDDTRS